MMRMRKLLGLTVLLILSISTIALAGVDPDENQPEFWGEDCHKIDESQGASWIADADYRLVVVKAGTDSHEFYNVVAGDVLSVGKDISHLILCTGGTPSTTTTTSSLATTTSLTTIPNQTTTTLGNTTTTLSDQPTTSTSVPPTTTTTIQTTTTSEGTTTSLPTTTTTQPTTTTSSVVTSTSPTTPTTTFPTTTTLPVMTTSVPAGTPTTTDPPLALPRTGANSLQLAALAVLLLISGVTVAAVTRGKR